MDTCTSAARRRDPLFFSFLFLSSARTSTRMKIREFKIFFSKKEQIPENIHLEVHLITARGEKGAQRFLGKGMKIFIWRLRADSGLRKDPAPRKDALISAYDGYVSQSETPTRPHSAPSTPIVRLIYVFSRVIRPPTLARPRRRGSVAMATPGVPAPNRRAPTPRRRRSYEDEKDDNN